MKLPLSVLLSLVWNSWPKGAKTVRQNLDGTLTLNYARKSITTSQVYPLCKNVEFECDELQWEKSIDLKPNGLNLTQAKRDLCLPDREKENLTDEYLDWCSRMDASFDSEPSFDYENYSKEELAKELEYRDEMLKVLLKRTVPTQVKRNVAERDIVAKRVSKRDRSYDTLAELVGTEFRLHPAAIELPWPFWIRQTPEGYIECMFSEHFAIPADRLTLREKWHELNFAFSRAEKPEDIYIRKVRRPKKYPIAKDAILNGQSVSFVASTQLVDLYNKFHYDNNENAPEPLFRVYSEVKKFEKSLE